MKIDAKTIHEQVRQRFALLASAPETEKRCEIGHSAAIKLNYDPAQLDLLPKAAVESFAGVGNPLALAPISPGSAVLDLGCGAGVDCMIAAQAVGPQGRVIGIDMTEEMVKKARHACVELGSTNIEIKQGMAHSFDVEDESVDVVTSNGLINLCPDKERVLEEVYRVLKPGGRLQMADMSLMDGVNPELLERAGEWSD